MRENRTILIGRKTAAILNADGRVPQNVIEMKSGVFVDPFDLDPDIVFIDDIAHNLARIARFAGCSDTYGAEHALIVESVLTTQGYQPLTRLHGIMHDAHEAYLGDVPKPLKYKPEFTFFRKASDVAQVVIEGALGIPTPTEDEALIVKHADELSLLIEARRGLPSRGECWRITTQDLVEKADEFALRITPKGTNHASLEAEFLHRYTWLRREVGL